MIIIRPSPPIKILRVLPRGRDCAGYDTVHMLAYNIIRQLMLAAAAKNDAKPREISFKGTLQAFTAFRDTMRTAVPERQAQRWEAMLVTIAHDRVGDRAGRVEPRAKKRRPKQYDLLNCPCADARRRLLEAG